MYHLFIMLLALTSSSLFAAPIRLSEAEIRQISRATQTYMQAGKSHWICKDNILASARIDLSGEVTKREKQLVTYGAVTFRCIGETKWQKGEYCEMIKNLSKKDAVWEFEYCDT